MFPFGQSKEHARKYHLVNGPLDGEVYTARIGATIIREIVGRDVKGRWVFVEYQVTAPFRAEFKRYIV